jgi:hypothetical protein
MISLGKWLPTYFRPLLLATAIGLLPVVTGLGILYWQMDKALLESVERDAESSVQEIDRIITLAANTAKSLLPLAGQRCDSAYPTLRQEVAREPHIRSANLVLNNTAYCSSFYGKYQTQVVAGDYLNGQLLLRAGNAVTPEEASLVYRMGQGNKSVRTVIDGRTLAETLRLISGEAVMILQVKQAYLWSGGSITNGDIPDHQEHHVLKKSAAHGYMIHGGYPQGMAWTMFKREAIAMLGNLLLLGVLTGGVCHWLMSRGSRHVPD